MISLSLQVHCVYSILETTLHPRHLFLSAAVLFSPVLLSAQTLPQPTPLPPPIAAPADTPYVAPITLTVDVTDNARRIANVHETVPVEGSELTLVYPEWIPGTHSPTGPISKVAGLVVTANGKRLAWVRDPVDVWAFHVPVPAGVKSVEVDFQYLAPIKPTEGRIDTSDEIIDLAWNTVVLYPAGHFSRQIHYEPTIKLPHGWKYASALEVASEKENVVTFKDVTLNNLVDSPLYAGVNFKRIDISSGPNNKVYLDLFGDTPEDIAITPELIEKHKALVVEAQKLYQSHHYDHYDFLFSISDKVGGNGLEHHQSSEDGAKANYFRDWDAGLAGRDLLGHEYTHSWDGKFRRPAGLWTPNFDVPMQDELLWVYEGMTQYWGNVLTARAGLRTADQARDLLAIVAANFEDSPGRQWRPMVDTTNQPTVSQRRPVSWVSWQRPEDYYTEGMLIWLDADTKIRELSKDTKSLDDFCKVFFGVDSGSYITHTYTFDDVVTALNTVAPYDWAGFLKARVYDLAPKVPEDGFTRGGYKLAYSDTPADWVKKSQAEAPFAAFSTSLGFNVAKDGTLGNVWWGSPAFKASVTPDMVLTAVNGTSFSAEVLRKAVVAAETSKSPIELLFKRGEKFQTIDLDYHGGLRYPRLERVAGTPDRLGAILAPSKAAMPQ